jgi:hypothetical protein
MTACRGGLALYQVLTLYTPPVIYIYFDRLQRWMSRGQRTQAAFSDAAALPAE